MTVTAEKLAGYSLAVAAGAAAAPAAALQIEEPLDFLIGGDRFPSYTAPNGGGDFLDIEAVNFLGFQPIRGGAGGFTNGGSPNGVFVSVGDNFSANDSFVISDSYGGLIEPGTFFYGDDIVAQFFNSFTYPDADPVDKYGEIPEGTSASVNGWIVFAGTANENLLDTTPGDERDYIGYLDVTIDYIRNGPSIFDHYVTGFAINEGKFVYGMPLSRLSIGEGDGGGSSEVPLPGALGLLAAGVAGLGALRRMRRAA